MSESPKGLAFLGRTSKKNHPVDVHKGKNSYYDKMCETVPKQNVLNKNLFDLDVLV